MNEKNKDLESIKTETLNEDEQNMLSEEMNIKLGEYDYDFNNKDENKIIIVKEKPEDNNIIINKEKKSSIKISINEQEENNIENENNITNDIISVKKEEESPSKKYKIINLGRNIMNLPENYSTDDEDEFNFINLINESNNDNFELAVDSKTVKVYAKVVSYKIYLILFLIDK